MNPDRRFLDIFMVIVGVLFLISIGVFVLSSQLSDRQYRETLQSDTAYQEQLMERIQPYGRVALPGEEQISEQEAALAAAEPVQEELTGAQVYNQACLACHGAGVGGAPVLGDAQAWTARAEKGKEILYDHAVNGYQGEAGYMPPKGGRLDLSDEEVYAAVDYIVEESL